MKCLFLALAFLALLPAAWAEAAKSDDSVCPMRMPPTKASGGPRALEYVSAYVGSPIEILKPERYDLPDDRFRWVWPVNHVDDFFVECRYAGGESLVARVPNSATSCEMRAHKVGQHKYRPYRIVCR